MRRPIGLVALGVLGIAVAAAAELPVEEVGRTEVLSVPPAPHWVWVTDIVLRRNALLDLDRGEFLGMVSTGVLPQAAVYPRGRNEFYLPETYFSRGSRGERTDVVTFYDTETLAVSAEVVIPPRRAVNVLPSSNAGLSDDGRFLAVFNMNPATSLSIVDVRERRFAGEIATPGCSLAFPAGARRWLMICTDGALLGVTVDDRGRQRRLERGEPFFEPTVDPVTDRAVRWKDNWIFVSFQGIVHSVDVSGDEPRVEPSWSLVSESERAEDWRMGGMQPLAVHERTGRLFVLMHRGGDDTHKQPGVEAWVFDLALRERIQRIELGHPGFAIMSETIGLPEPFDGVWSWLLDHVVPFPGIDAMQVTQDTAPLLVTGSQLGGSVGVYEALTGRFLRRVTSGNLTTHFLQAPWGGVAEAAP